MFLWKDDAFEDTYKLKSGQVCKVWFIRYAKDKHIDYIVAFAVANKKKDLEKWIRQEANQISYKYTGKSGVEPLLWCRKKIIEFEELVAEDDTDSRIIVSGEDNRRFRAYEYGLKNYGYRKVFINGYWAMIKDIKRREVINNG